MIDNKYFRTNNFYLSCYLYSKDCQLVNIDRLEDSKRAEFVFVDSLDLRDMIDSYNFAKVCLVDARKFSLAIKSLKSKLYDYKD